jgi:hypothetical protein
LSLASKSIRSKVSDDRKTAVRHQLGIFTFGAVQPDLQDSARARRHSKSFCNPILPLYIFECEGNWFCREFAHHSELDSFLFEQFVSDLFLIQNGRIVVSGLIVAGGVFYVICRL